MFRSYSEPRNTDVPGRVFARIKSWNSRYFGEVFMGAFLLRAALWSKAPARKRETV
jgi:hypothetical protein